MTMAMMTMMRGMKVTLLSILTLFNMQPLTTAKEEGPDSILPEKRQGTLPVEVSQLKFIVL